MASEEAEAGQMATEMAVWRAVEVVAAMVVMVGMEVKRLMAAGGSWVMV
jgi:hypothetical protein